ncbi:disease resistance TIR-NBS-LRR class family protein [Tanacetum coccineum]
MECDGSGIRKKQRPVSFDALSIGDTTHVNLNGPEMPPTAMDSACVRNHDSECSADNQSSKWPLRSTLGPNVCSGSSKLSAKADYASILPKNKEDNNITTDLKHTDFRVNIVSSENDSHKDLGQLESLEKLYVSSKKIEYLPDSICMLKRLKWLIAGDCCCLGKLPEDIGQLESLERLVLTATKIKHLPDSICMLKHMKYLILDLCVHLEKLPEDLGRLECLEELVITHTGISYLPHSIFGLRDLAITASPKLLHSYNFPSGIKTIPKGSRLIGG